MSNPPTQRGEECLCGTCGDDVGPDPVGCDKCEHWVHGTQMCSGLPQDLISAILKYDGAGIQFICMKCRVEQVAARGNSPSGHTDPQLAETVKQLHIQVRGMCTVIKELTSQVKTLSSKPPQLPNHDAASTTTQRQATAPPSLPPQTTTAADPPQDYRTLIREELKEQKEREKRRAFVVVKGLSASSTTDFKTKFTEFASDFTGARVEASEILAIPGQSNFFRVKILDESSRKLLLDKAKQLRDSDDYKNIYVSRDLTYAQRTEQYHRRRQTRQAQELQAGSRTGGEARQSHQAPAVVGTTAARADTTDRPLRAAPDAASSDPSAPSVGN